MRPLIPRSLLFGNPFRVAPQLSPDGRWISFIAPLDGTLNLWVAPSDDAASARPVTRDSGHGIRSYGWIRSGRHLWYLQDQGGDENFHLHSVAIDDGATLDLTPFAGVQARIVGFSRTHPQHALIGLNHRDRRWHDVHRVDLLGGQLELIERNEGYAQYFCDEDLRLRMALRNAADGGRDVLAAAAGGGWRELFHIGRDDVLTTTPVAIGGDPDTAYFLDSRGRDTAAAVMLALQGGSVTVLGEHAATDVLGLSLNPLTRAAEAYLTDHLDPQWSVIDPAVAQDYQRLHALGLGHFSVVDRSGDDRRWLVAFTNDRLPGRYYLYDRDSGAARLLFSARPDLEDQPLSQMRSLVIPARDGLGLVSYLTIPASAAVDAGGAPAQPLPLVLLVHGGPWSRDTYGYKPEHQLLADRGYAVLSVNFRGSTGFGKAFVNAGNLEWGGRMQEDLLDAIDWAVARGIAQRDRVAIMGGSYGGYAALVGLTFTPQVFACAIDIVGPSNLETLLASFPPYWAPLLENFALRVGDPRTEEGRALLRARSPLHRSGDIVRPLLIAQGANDVRVTRVESDQMVAAMQAAGVPVTYALYPDEGHGLARAANRLSFMALAEAFLARFLGGECEAFGDVLRHGSLIVEAGGEHIPGAG